MSAKSLSAQIDDEARRLSKEKGIPYERVLRCEWDIFIFHCATGDDADCWCGAHVSDLRPLAEEAPVRLLPAPSGKDGYGLGQNSP